MHELARPPPRSEGPGVAQRGGWTAPPLAYDFSLSGAGRRRSFCSAFIVHLLVTFSATQKETEFGEKLGSAFGRLLKLLLHSNVASHSCEVLWADKAQRPPIAPHKMNALYSVNISMVVNKLYTHHKTTFFSVEVAH